jgi:S-DNA-T family DNA segregation ATPase FtsK/SpoIIIE
VRIQGAFIATDDTDLLMKWFRERAEARRLAEEAAALEAGEEAAPPADDDSELDILDEVRSRDLQDASAATKDEVADEWDELFRAAAEVCVQNQGGSTSLLQRKLRIGYGRAARIVDQLEAAGVLGPADGSKPREVLIGLEGLDLLISGRD